MEEGNCDFEEKELVEDSDDEHQVFDEMPVRVRQFYFVKLLPLVNPNKDAMIKKAEYTIEKTNRDQVLIAQKLRKRVLDSDDVSSKLCRLKYYEYDNCEFSLKWHRERLDILHLSLDKLTFANNAYKEKSTNSCSSGGEVNKQKLSFLMVHGHRNRADERKLLKKINASQGKDGGITVEELHAPIQRLWDQMCCNHWDYEKTTDDDVAREKAILKDLKQYQIARESAISNAVVNGKLWNSLGLQEAIQAELQELDYNSDEPREDQIRVNAKIKKVKKELKKVEKDISSLQKRLKDTNRKKDAAYNTILKLKKQCGEENACYYQHHSLMEKVEVLAKKKDIAAVQELAQEQVEKFMRQWNNCEDFRNDYKKRVVPSLNSRHLGVDGRMLTNQKPRGDDTRKVIKPEALSITRLKCLMKDAEDPSELLF